MSIISIQNVSKTYDNGFQATKSMSLEIKENEILALLGPNGAGKTTLIGMICGLVQISDGKILINGFDNVKKSKEARKEIGLVPQELTTNMFETVWNTVSLSRGLFGLKKNPKKIEDILKTLSLWEKRNAQLRQLSGGMKRRVMIAKALSHEPNILFLDEPSAGVDVELRKDMWATVRKLRQSGVTIILTTHYIEEAEEMADRIGIIRNGELIMVEEKNVLIKKLGKKMMEIELSAPLEKLPESLKKQGLEMRNGTLYYHYDSKKEDNKISNILDILKKEGIVYTDIQTKQSSLEDIFVELVNQ